MTRTLRSRVIVTPGPSTQATTEQPAEAARVETPGQSEPLDATTRLELVSPLSSRSPTNQNSGAPLGSGSTPEDSATSSGMSGSCAEQTPGGVDASGDAGMASHDDERQEPHDDGLVHSGEVSMEMTDQDGTPGNEPRSVESTLVEGRPPTPASEYRSVSPVDWSEQEDDEDLGELPEEWIRHARERQRNGISIGDVTTDALQEAMTDGQLGAIMDRLPVSTRNIDDDSDAETSDSSVPSQKSIKKVRIVPKVTIEDVTDDESGYKPPVIQARAMRRSESPDRPEERPPPVDKGKSKMSELELKAERQRQEYLRSYALAMEERERLRKSMEEAKARQLAADQALAERVQAGEVANMDALRREEVRIEQEYLKKSSIVESSGMPARSRVAYSKLLGGRDGERANDFAESTPVIGKKIVQLDSRARSLSRPITTSVIEDMRRRIEPLSSTGKAQANSSKSHYTDSKMAEIPAQKIPLLSERRAASMIIPNTTYMGATRGQTREPSDPSSSSSSSSDSSDSEFSDTSSPDSDTPRRERKRKVLKKKLYHKQVKIARKKARRPEPKDRDLKLDLPKAYRGGESFEVYDDWIHDMEQYFALTGIHSEEKKIRVLGLAVEGKAKVWYRRHVATRIDEWDWELARTALFDYCFTTEFRAVMRAKFENAQRGDKSVKDWALELLDLAARVEGITDRIIVIRFWNGLSKRMRGSLASFGYSKEIHSLEEILEMAEQLERAERETEYEMGTTYRKDSDHRPRDPDNRNGNSRGSVRGGRRWDKKRHNPKRDHHPKPESNSNSNQEPKDKTHQKPSSIDHRITKAKARRM
jgi:Retrotransposon gag protein